MKKCLIWGMGKVFTSEMMTIRYLEVTHQIQVCGITSNFERFSHVAGYTFVPKDEIDVKQYDVVFIMADGNVFQEIQEEAIQIGFSEDILVHHRVLHILNDNLDKYLEIKKNKPTIFANSCWGGFAYHTLGLEFLSPLINMSLSEEDYLKFLVNPKWYMKQDLAYCGEGTGTDKTFPLARCGDIVLRFDHYASFEIAKDKWNRRKQKINWNNLFVMFCTENKSYVDIFERLDYLNKICYSPFENDFNDHIQINFYRKNNTQHNSFGSMVACLASDQYQYMDLIDLLYDGTITKLSEER